MTSEHSVQGQAGGDPTSSDGRSAVAIVSSLWEKTEALVQLEMKLGLAEAEEKIDALKRELVAKAIGGAIVFAGMLTLVAALVAALALAMDLWLAASLTGIVVIAAGFLLLRRPHMSQTLATDNAQTRTPLSAATKSKETSHGTV